MVVRKKEGFVEALKISMELWACQKQWTWPTRFEEHQEHVWDLKSHMISEFKKHFDQIDFHGEIVKNSLLYCFECLFSCNRKSFNAYYLL